jgi:signal transduction histidine kinase
VRKLVEAQGGRVEVEAAPTGGALIRLRLPLAEESA